MQGLSKQRALEDLRARIETIEKRAPLALARGVAASGPDAGRFTLPAGLLHEVFTQTHRNAGAALGFALGATHSLVTAERPVLLHLQMSGEGQETGLPYGAGLAAFGIDPEALILIRPANIVELLWAAEEALACRAVAAVVADVGSDPKALDFTASRRLGVRAHEGKSTLLLLRYGQGRTASAARLRWQLEPALSGETRFDPQAPGDSRWWLTLEKGLWQGKPNGRWLLSWTKNGFDILDTADAGRAAGFPPLPRALSAALGDRLSQTA